MNKSRALKNLLTSNKLEFLMESHNGLSAKITEEAGFAGIWASGLSISASLGVRDCNEASWTQMLEIAEFMSDATSIPILLDGDTGYGNFNNMRRLVKKLEQRDIAGVCIEDKVFPKKNSFINSNEQQLEDIDLFCNKIKAGLDSISNDDFCIVARTEALITGLGIQEALTRAHAYSNAGATAVLVHSKQEDLCEVNEFMQQWDDSCPIIIVPTTYYQTPTSQFIEAGVSTVIWANHLIRSAVTAMQNTAQQIYNQQSLINTESNIASMEEIFRLQNEHELKQAESKYLN